MLTYAVVQAINGAGRRADRIGEHHGVAPIVFILFAIVVAIAIGLLVAWLVDRHYKRVAEARAASLAGGAGAGFTAGATDAMARFDSPVDILKTRYARGEIDKAEFDEKLKDLNS